ncbi:hypothetical protein XENOCAPTIV_030543, partial [Xenoophorus captivus]
KLPQRSSLWALSLSLSAVNLSESAQGKMAPAQFAQIYVTAATALRTVLGHHLTFLSGYLIGCAESVANQSETKQIPDCLRWLFTPLGRQFFLSCDWSVKSDSIHEVFTSQRDPGLLLCVFPGLLFSTSVMFCFYTPLFSYFLQLTPSPSCTSVSAGSFWKEPEFSSALEFLEFHPLPKAVLLLCKVVQMSLSTLKGDGVVACLSHCDRASGYLRSSISVPLAQGLSDLHAPATRPATLTVHRSENQERAHAILLACRHLPMPLLTPPGHRARLLAEAKRTLERVGDRRSVQDCQQILLRLSGGTTIAAS